MNKLNHTPGPWQANRVWVMAGEKVEIATVNPYVDQKESNAQLIAAAPDMLEALIELYREYTEEIGINIDVEKIIERATGKTWEELSK